MSRGVTRTFHPLRRRWGARRCSSRGGRGGRAADAGAGSTESRVELGTNQAPLRRRAPQAGRGGRERERTRPLRSSNPGTYPPDAAQPRADERVMLHEIFRELVLLRDDDSGLTWLVFDQNALIRALKVAPGCVYPPDPDPTSIIEW